MSQKFSLVLLTLLLSHHKIRAQEINKEVQDSLFINETEDREPIKILHAEPLYIDLIRDLGARKGEEEWNVGFGLTDRNRYDEYEALIEYEWAPVDRLGLEIELPFTLYPSYQLNDAPSSKLNGLKMAIQYTFLVSETLSTSMAFGYINELEMAEFKNYGKENLFTGNVYNPFLVVAKRWRQNFHTLVYAGPEFLHHFDDQVVDVNWQINTNIHYMIRGTRNFIGVEFNKNINQNRFDMTIRPQMRVSLADNLLVGIVTGIPVSRDNERFSSFLRLIYEPRHRH